MRATLFDIGAVGGGRLALTPRPRGNDWLGDEIAGLRDAGVGVLVSLLTPEENEDLGLLEEAALARAAGIEFASAPVRDRGVPRDQAAFLAVVEVVEKQLSAGKYVAAHCRHSLGRGPLLVASVMVRAGIEAEAAWAKVSAARGVPCPEMAEQRAWVANLAGR
jgi:protein-tyrosine phosphatase